ncbi:MAG: ABC transporter ATP-binding protein [Patescibacteria group bacterium]|nr:ABC transporter ATP-binding protein [Patescibacteria group bacterium]
MLNHTKQTLKIFWQHAIKYRWQAVVSFACLIAVSALRTVAPILYRNLINLAADNSNKADLGPLIFLIILILIINAGRVSIWRSFNFVINFLESKVMADLTNTCYQYLQNHSYNFFSNSFVGSLVTKVKRYERSFEIITDQIFYNLGRTLVEIVFILAVTLWQFPQLGLFVLGWSILYITFAYYYSLYKLPIDIKRAEADTKTTAQLADTITNNINIKLFGGYGNEIKKFGEVVDEQRRLRRKGWNLGTLGDIVQNIFNVSLEFIIFYLALHLWQQGRLTVGDLLLLQAYLLRLFDILWDTGKNIRNIYEALADADEMTQILLLPHEVTDTPNAQTLTVRRGEILFAHVNFSYHQNQEVLENFNLLIRPGERVALIGPSGGGKSTIVKLLFRFHDIQGGQILIDGQNIAAATQLSLRDNLALVPQEPILFHRSLMENIRYGKPSASDAEVMAAAHAAHAHEFISRSPEGYKTFVGERGMKLSGGERQRVAIARAILKNAPILVLDEATSSLDSESEQFIQDALQKLMAGKTVIVIAHRLSTIMQMDRIIVLENGRITEQGKHDELIKAKQGTYQKLWQIQAGGFGLASRNML